MRERGARGYARPVTQPYHHLLPAMAAEHGARNSAQECRFDMTFDDETSRKDQSGRDRRHQPSPLGGRYFADLLKNVENEPVPDRLLDLARQLEQALAERGDKPGKESGGSDER